MWSNADYAEQPSTASPGPAYGPVAIAPPAPGALALAHPAGPRPALHTAPGAHASESSYDIPPTLMERIELCKFLASANLLPKALHDAPANVLLIMHKALALGLPLAVALEHLHVIDGKVGHSAELLRALLHHHGHQLNWITTTDKEVVGELVLRHDPKRPRQERFTIADATRMELTNKPNWKKDPVSMMVARCTTRLVSRHCPEVSMALGNLSAIDAEEEPPPVRASAEVVDASPEQQAAALYAEAAKANDSDALKSIGARAREAGLLEVVVDGDTTLQAALLHRIGEITNARQQEPPPDPTPGKGKGRSGS